VRIVVDDSDWFFSGPKTTTEGTMNKLAVKILGDMALAACLVGAVVLCASCASIIHGGSQDVSMASVPPAASVTVYDGAGKIIGQGSTPCTLSLKRGEGFFKSANYRVLLEKTGYAPHTVSIEGRLDGWYIAGNLVFGGLIGWLIVDPATGAMWTLKPDEVSVALGQGGTSLMTPRGANEGLTVVLRQQVPQGCMDKAKPIQVSSAVLAD